MVRQTSNASSSRSIEQPRNINGEPAVFSAAHNRWIERVHGWPAGTVELLYQDDGLLVERADQVITFARNQNHDVPQPPPYSAAPPAYPALPRRTRRSRDSGAIQAEPAGINGGGSIRRDPVVFPSGPPQIPAPFATRPEGFATELTAILERSGISPVAAATQLAQRDSQRGLRRTPAVRRAGSDADRVRNAAVQRRPRQTPSVTGSRRSSRKKSD